MAGKKDGHDRMYDKIQRDAARGVYNQKEGSFMAAKVKAKPIPPNVKSTYPAGI